MPLSNYAITHTYEEVEKLIFKISHTMSQRYYVPFEDVLAEAQLIFVRCHQSYDPRHNTAFSTWLYNKLHWGLTDKLKTEYRAALHVELTEEMAGTYTDHPGEAAEFLAMLSDEARMVVLLIRKSPVELRRMMLRENAAGRKQIKKVIFKYMRRLGWAGDEILRGFEELKTVLGPGAIMEPALPKPIRPLRRLKLTKAQVWSMCYKYRTA